MRTLADLFRHQAWANELVFGACAQAEPGWLTAAAPGTQGTPISTVGHLVRVEDAYLTMIESRPLDSLEPRDTYARHDLAWFRSRCGQLDASYVVLAEASTEGPAGSLERPLTVPWFDFPITAREGLYQVLSHSAQHRSQVLSHLGSRGLEVPDLDYVLMLKAQRSPS